MPIAHKLNVEIKVFLLGAVTVALPTIGRDLNFQEVCFIFRAYYAITQCVYAQGNLYWPVNVNSYVSTIFAT
jgi:hypothetical protein